MKLEEIQSEEFYVLCAPDGAMQLTTLSPDFPTCVGMIKLLHKSGVSKSFHQMVNIDGYKILPVKVTIIQDGDENKAFKKTVNPINN